jgi:hypothetical protein
MTGDFRVRNTGVIWDAGVDVDQAPSFDQPRNLI